MTKLQQKRRDCREGKEWYLECKKYYDRHDACFNVKMPPIRKWRVWSKRFDQRLFYLKWSEQSPSYLNGYLGLAKKGSTILHVRKNK